jgi:ABC-type amino acid transport substrate-binding protein
LAALAKGEVQAALLFGPFVGWHIHENYKDQLKVSTAFERQPEWHWNLAIAVTRQDTLLKEQLDQALGKMLADGRIAKILESYGVHFDPPSTN